jgi:hypothetical protein
MSAQKFEGAMAPKLNIVEHHAHWETDDVEEVVGFLAYVFGGAEDSRWHQDDSDWVRVLVPGIGIPFLVTARKPNDRPQVTIKGVDHLAFKADEASFDKIADLVVQYGYKFKVEPRKQVVNSNDVRMFVLWGPDNQAIEVILPL